MVKEREVLPHQQEHVKRHTIDKRQATTSTNDSIQWTSYPQEWRPCDALSLSWTGGLAPYTIAATWWPDGSEQTAELGRQWRIVQGTQENNYEWMVNVPANSTVHIDCFDSSATPRLSDTINLHVNFTTMRGYNSSWCLEDDPSAINAIPGVQVWNISSSLQSDNNAQAAAAAAPEITKFVYLDNTYEIDTLNSKINGISAAMAIFIITTFIMTLLYWRTRQRLKRMEKVKNWMNDKSERSSSSPKHLDDKDVANEKKPWESFTSSVQHKKGTFFNFGNNNKKPTLAPMSRALILPYNGSNKDLPSTFYSSKASNFTSRARDNNDLTRDIHTRFISSNSTNSAHYTESVMSSSNPFDDDKSASSSQSGYNSQRMSRAETTTSEAPTIATHNTTGTAESEGSRFSSSAASEQASTVGGVSTVSDEFWSRTKASTISPITPASSSSNGAGSKAFLMPFGGR